MAHFAELDSNSIVTRVLVVDNFNILDSEGNESEEVGIDFLRSVFPDSGDWVQTSYNGNFRIRYAGIGMKYYEEYDGFGHPAPPGDNPSWVLNTTTLEWEPPTPMPTEEATEGHFWSWDEPSVSWIETPFAPPPDV